MRLRDQKLRKPNKLICKIQRVESSILPKTLTNKKKRQSSKRLRSTKRKLKDRLKPDMVRQQKVTMMR